MECKTVVFSDHASHRMLTRGILIDEVLAALRTGEVIESYPSDTPFHSVLLLGRQHGLALHVVVATDQENGLCIVVTVDRPDEERWDAGFRMRRQG